MRYLLDTHTFLWWIADDSRLSSTARLIIRNAENQILFSAASVWEIAIKAQLGRLDFVHDPSELIPRLIAENALLNLPIEVGHAPQVLRLPLQHRDPFDRILVAQAQVERVPILTADPLIAQYDVAIAW